MKREYPKIEAKTWKWILAFIISIGSFYGVSLLFAILDIRNEIIMALAVSVISLLSLVIVDRYFIVKIFLPLKRRDLLYIIIGLGFSIIAVVVSSIVVTKLGIKSDVNPIFEVLTPDNFKSFFISTLIQFIAEEIIFIIPFLFVINKMKSENKILKTILAIILSSVIFGAMHLSTYNYNILQAVLIISIIRTGLSMSYVLSKNLTVTYLIHIIYDWSLIGIYIAAGQMIK
ncbi:MAG: CPBP family intramembrane metalloprotease [Peptoniphilus sp.]|uniref:CPBP family intramembrane glutamic endopeptidase n=1 Tax=Peptoniphilus sp. TaxID=1971214 RepID=UPI0025E0D35F|nr:CPBP family intramembrane glutamic endopeptidase [Peptoniphilus sp.]MCI5642776.1 CPBP family intramembrane metalloprotease [Peptoniphilus sp.]MDD7352700.1 CPBP family intramembrane metalloprotease [Peptoniphilaceae bacterium]MDY3902775.1 CPBP family intramembrane glutamic endopeptidase [Peptoniphilus sp.]